MADPAPADREHREQEADDRGDDVAIDHQVRCLATGDAEGDDEGEVVEQLQRRRGAMGFVEALSLIHI